MTHPDGQNQPTDDELAAIARHLAAHRSSKLGNCGDTHLCAECSDYPGCGQPLLIGLDFPNQDQIANTQGPWWTGIRCSVCDLPFTPDEWEDRHRVGAGEAHTGCCPCNKR
jgi:hypothetical protein